MKIEELLEQLPEAKFPIHNEKGNLVKYLEISSVEYVEENGGLLITFGPMLIATPVGERIIKYYKEYLEEQRISNGK